MSENTELNYSAYYREHGRVLKCPYCGSNMLFISFSYYDSVEKYWACNNCTLTMPDKKHYTDEELSLRRRRHRRELKRELAKLEQKVETLRKHLQMLGKFMSAEERKKLLVEELASDDEYRD